MGIVKAEIPKVLKVFVWPADIEPNASFHPLFEGLQHAIGPHRAFHPGPWAWGFSCLFSPCGHCRRFNFAPCKLHASTFLRPLAPRALPRFLATMNALTPARPGVALLTQIHPRPFYGQVSLVHITRPSMHSVTKHLTRPIIAFLLPAQRDRLPESCASVGLAVLHGAVASLTSLRPGPDFALNPQAHRCVRPNRVRKSATDCMFASGCSPPHLAVTQLPSASGGEHPPWEDFHLPDRACSQAHGFPHSRE
jgi:hypothetical protein